MLEVMRQKVSQRWLGKPRARGCYTIIRQGLRSHTAESLPPRASKKHEALRQNMTPWTIMQSLGGGHLLTRTKRYSVYWDDATLKRYRSCWLKILGVRRIFRVKNMFLNIAGVFTG